MLTLTPTRLLDEAAHNSYSRQVKSKSKREKRECADDDADADDDDADAERKKRKTYPSIFRTEDRATTKMTAKMTACAQRS